MGNLNISISADSVSSTKAHVKARNFSFHIDEPENLGGTDSAANPVEYLLGSYAGCINVMAHLIAKEQGITLDGLSIKISGKLNPDRLFGASNAERAGFQNIQVQISPKTDAPVEKVKAWIKAIEDRCPVNDNLLNPTPISVTHVQA